MAPANWCAQYAVLCAVRKHSDGVIICTSGMDPALQSGPVDLPVVSHGLWASCGRNAARSAWSMRGRPCGDWLARRISPGAHCVDRAHRVAVVLLRLAVSGQQAGADAFSADDEKILAILGAQGLHLRKRQPVSEVQQHAEQLQVQVQERQRAVDALRANKATLRRPRR